MIQVQVAGFEVTNFCMRADYSALDYDMPVEY
ncbi:hypothetical protein FHX71_002278 [Promicromonospora sukumoe]|uniref:Uncharacterized protein n=1 Tax=Promicromonospora sukumoe TaxID=88382 RepID=A0A7W3J8Q0_9MICO|nr:hypothetical protein [Promicromonospora sukumoe]